MCFLYKILLSFEFLVLEFVWSFFFCVGFGVGVWFFLLFVNLYYELVVFVLLFRDVVMWMGGWYIISWCWGERE